MRLCILCSDENITDARERAQIALPATQFQASFAQFKKNKGETPLLDHLKIPLSETGELPATHWFCFINANEDMYQRILASQHNTIIEEAIPSEFLEKHNLKKIKNLGTGL